MLTPEQQETVGTFLKQMLPEQQEAFQSILEHLGPDQQAAVLARMDRYLHSKSSEAVQLEANIAKTEAEIESLRYRCTRCKNPERVRRMAARADRLEGEVSVMKRYAGILARRAADADDNPDRDVAFAQDPETFKKILAGIMERTETAEAERTAVAKQLDAAPADANLLAKAEALDKELRMLRMHVDMLRQHAPTE